MRHDPYAEKQNADGSKTKYATRNDYVRGRYQASATASAQRAGINRAVGGSVV